MHSIQYSTRKVADAAKASTQCAVVTVTQGGDAGAPGAQLDAASGNAISAALATGDFSGKAGETLMLPGMGKARRVLLLGLGKADAFDRDAARKMADSLYSALKGTKARDALLFLGDMPLEKDETAWFLEMLARSLTTAAYRYTETLKKPDPALSLSKLAVETGGRLSPKQAQAALDQGRHTGEGVNLARNLGNLPGNICTPDYLARQARRMARGNDRISTRVLDEKKMRELGMGALLSVTAGTREPARLIIMEYSGGKGKDQPYVLVGKGITFDSGGISLKPGPKMDEMKFDMGGAAAVFGTLHAVSALELPLNVIGIVAAAENMPSGTATKPGDVVTSMSGKTIEILNTDAEGRLVLCDALTYAERFKPAAVVDCATLTGACIVALGSHAAGLYANRDELAEQLLEAGGEAHDRAWRMPLWEDYGKELKSNFADLANIGGPGAGSVTAACFLAEFTDKYPWAHLDIAGPAFQSSPKGATGRPVPLLTRYLLARAGRG